MSDLYCDNPNPIGFIGWYARENGLQFKELYDYCYGPYQDGLAKVRFINKEGKKDFRWISESHGTTKSGFHMTHKGCANRLYVAGSIDDEKIILVEGEKDADSVHKAFDITAVCTEDGAAIGKPGSKWKPEYEQQLTGKIVYVMGDNDDAGQNFALIEAQKLTGHAAAVYMTDLVAAWPECPEKGDITDLITSVGKEKAKEIFADIMANAKPFEPAPTPENIEGLDVYQAKEVKPVSRETVGKNPADILSHFQPLSADSGRPLAEKRCIFKPYFPLGKFSIVSADPGTGKTKVVDAIAALVTVGGNLCGIPCEKTGNVLIFSMEDDRDDHLATIEHCGGDMSKVILPGQKDEDIDYFASSKLTFGSPEIEVLINHYRPVLVIFDPYQKYVGSKTDTDKANKLSEALTPLTLLSRKYDCHILVVAHNIKAQTSKLQYKFMGSVDFIGEARSAMMVVRDPDRLQENENIIIHIKSNNKRGQSIRYRIDSIPENEDYATVIWLGREDYSERDYMLSNRSLLQSKARALTEITDEDLTIKMILDIVRDNPAKDEIRIGIQDFNQCYIAFNGKRLRENVTKEIKRVSEYLEQNHGVLVDCPESRLLMVFNFMGKVYKPYKNSSRCVRTIRDTTTRLISEQTEIQD